MAEKEYIEREAAYPLAKKICDAIDSEDFQRLNFGMRILDWIDDLPAADVRPVVKAHWYWDKDGMDWNIGAWRCSACTAMSPMWWNTDRGSPMHKSGHNFCPNCGADMRGES